MSLATIVKGNTFSLAIPLQVYAVEDGEVVLRDYTPESGDAITIRLKGDRRNYTYIPSTNGSTAFIHLEGSEVVGVYAVEVEIVKDDDSKLTSMRFEQLSIVESIDELNEGQITEGIEQGAIYLDPEIFIAGEDGRGIVSIIKTATVGLVDTYTISYTDNTTSTFNVTNGKDGINGQDGKDGADGQDGVGIASIAKTATQGLVDTYTITLTNGTLYTFTVTNGKDGENGQDGRDGTDGTDGVGIVSITKTGTVGLVDTYTISYTDGTKSTFNVTNGADGQQAPLDNDVTANSPNAVKSSGIYTAIQNAMPFLVTVTWDSVSEHYTNTDLTIADLEAAYNRGQKITLNFVGGDADGAQLDIFAKLQDLYVFAGIVGTKSQLAPVTGGATDTISVDISATEIDPNVPYVMEAGTNPSLGLSPNTFYKFNDPITSLTIVGLNGVAPANVLKVYAFSFTAGVDNPTITLPQGVQIADAPTIATGDYVEFSIMDNKAVAIVWQAQ